MNVKDTPLIQLLRKLQRVSRQTLDPLIHRIHVRHRISHRTLLYVKEYGPKSHVAQTIVRESILILVLAVAIDSFGGVAVERLRTIFIAIVPLVILLPVLNDAVGDYGTIVSSRVSTMLHEGTLGKKWWKNLELNTLFRQILIIAMATGILSTAVAVVVARASGAGVDTEDMTKIFVVVLADVVFLVMILFFVATLIGIFAFKRQEDPNNILIPITTSLADFGNMIFLAAMVAWLF